MFSSNRLLSKEEARELDLSNRIALEAQITDRRTEQIDFEWFKSKDTDFERFARSMPARQYLLDFLGPLEGKVMLDVACGYSMSPVIFALAGATVFALDVAPRTVSTVQRFAEYKGVGDRVCAMVAPGEYLPFPSASFDCIYGNAALHHLQLWRAGPELARVLRPGGRAGFQDPLGENAVLEFVRDHLPYRKKHPEKGTDHPLRLSDVEGFSRYFSTCTYRTFQLFSMLVKPLNLSRTSPIRGNLQRLDDAIFERLPPMRKYARHVVICATKESGSVAKK